MWPILSASVGNTYWINWVCVLNKSTLITAFSYYLLLLWIFSKSSLYLYPRSYNPFTTNSNNVFKLLGEGAVTKILLNPNLIAAAMPNPIAADLPRPLAALRATVVLLDLSVSTYTKDIITLAWSNVFDVWSKAPTTYFSARSFFKLYNYFSAFVLID